VKHNATLYTELCWWRLYRSRDRRLSAKLVATFADKRCHVVSVTDPPGQFLGFLDRSRNCFLQAATQLYWRGWVDPVSDPLLLRKSGRPGSNPGLWICSQELWPLDHGPRNDTQIENLKAIARAGIWIKEFSIFWDIMPCSQLTVNWRFGGKYRNHLHGRKIDHVINQNCFHA
jgi:hypothetical protein